jgi:citrate synthase
MRIGKQTEPFTAIATSDEHSITVRGKDLCGELIGQIGFTDYFFFLVTGRQPTENQRFFLDALMVSIAEHGLVPSVQAARMTYDASPEAFHGAVAAGLLGCGSVVFGSSEAAGRFLHALVEKGGDAKATATAAVTELRAGKKPIPGYGHPQHASGDPRANVLLKLADERGVSGAHIAMLRTVAEVIPDIVGRPLPINISGAIPAVALDIGFPLEGLKGIPLLARTAGLIAHLTEESTRQIGFIMSHHADMAIQYDGPPAKKT